MAAYRDAKTKRDALGFPVIESHGTSYKLAGSLDAGTFYHAETPDAIIPHSGRVPRGSAANSRLLWGRLDG